MDFSYLKTARSKLFKCDQAQTGLHQTYCSVQLILGSKLGITALSDQAVAMVVKDCLPTEGSTKFSSHSLRAGFVSSALIGGASVKAVLNQTGHRSLGILLLYMREANLFKENAVKSTGC